MQENSLRHIDWIDLDNIIITSSKKTYHDNFMNQVKNLKNKVRIIRLITTDDNSFLNLYKQFNREIILNEILKDDK